MSGREDVIVAQDMAAGSVTGATGVALKTRGARTARTGVGTYTVTFDPDLPGGPGIVAAECLGAISVVNAVPHIASFENTSNTVKTLNIATNAGVAADIDFTYKFSRLVGG